MRLERLVASSIIIIILEAIILGDRNVVSGDTTKRVQVLNGSPYAQLQHGLYFGKTLKCKDHEICQFHAFLGVRYAATPERYEKSVLMTDLDMMSLPLLAQSLGSPCPQITPNGTLLGKEDCLLANVFVPNEEPIDKDGFPVIVFIHPGSFKTGNGGAFDVSHFMTENVICVTFNFRLGSLGFLNAEGTSNLGLMDQITLLEWVNANIGSFGGNKRRITLAGIESGATSVKALLLSQSSKGLFQGAIIHGGLMFPIYSPHPTTSAKQFSDELECPHRPAHLLVECLKTKRLKDLMRSQKLISEQYFDFSSPFQPSMETCDSRFALCPHSFFTKPPALLLSQREYKRVPLLIGMYSPDELLNSYIMMTQRRVVLPFQQESHGVDRETLSRWLVGVLQQIPGLQVEIFFRTEIFAEIQQLYFIESLWNNGTATTRATLLHKSLSHFLYDIFVVYSLWKFVMTYATDKPVYPYIISFPETRRNQSVSDHYGTAFPDGIEFLTPSLPVYHDFQKGSDEQTFSRQLVHLWATFSTHQKPVDVWDNKETWLPLSSAQLNGEKPLTWYSLNKQVDMIPDPFTKRMKLLDKVFKETGG